MPQRRYHHPRRQRDDARIAAFEALHAVTMDGAYANLALAEILGRSGLAERDAAFATELCHGTCRGLGTYDAIIEAAGGRPLASLEAAVVDVLRLGAHQLLGMRVPTHAAVAASVDLVAVVVGERATGVVNAILRKVAAHSLTGWCDALGADLDDTEALGLRTLHPAWVVEAFADVLPPGELEAALAGDNESPAPTLVVRPGLAEVADLGAPTRYSPFGATTGRPPHTLPAVRSGRAGVQDEGSQLVAWALSRPDAPTGPWLDLCAGPGGKAALLSGLAAQAGAGLLASEVAPHRAALVRQAVRAYHDRPGVVCADGTRPAWRDGAFARVMADVPCSGLGSLRRRPESRWRRLPEDLAELAPLQRALLTTALASVAPGGLVAYVTCSPHRAETADVVAAVVGGRDDVEVLDAPAVVPEVPDTAARTDPRFVQLWPHRHGTDAMFLALLRRR